MTWEYLVRNSLLSEEALGKLGAEGWELVAVVSPGHFVLHYFFKRRVRTRPTIELGMLSNAANYVRPEQREC